MYVCMYALCVIYLLLQSHMSHSTVPLYGRRCAHAPRARTGARAHGRTCWVGRGSFLAREKPKVSHGIEPLASHLVDKCLNTLATKLIHAQVWNWLTDLTCWIHNSCPCALDVSVMHNFEVPRIAGTHLAAGWAEGVFLARKKPRSLLGLNHWPLAQVNASQTLIKLFFSRDLHVDSYFFKIWRKNPVYLQIVNFERS